MEEELDKNLRLYINGESTDMKFVQVPTIGHPYVEDSIGSMLSSIENDLCELQGKIDAFQQTVQILLSDKYKKHRSVIADKRRLLRKYAKLVK